MSTYYIIQRVKYNFPKEHFKHTIMKDSDYNLTTASEMLVAYRTINENEDVSFHLQEVDARAISKKEVA